MILLVRYALVALRSRSSPPIGPLDDSTIRLRVLPNDLDINLHLNNGRYVSLMDLGRLDLISRVGVLRVAFRQRWQPVVGSLTIRFRRSLGAFQSFDLRTRLVSWDEKWFYVEQRFERDGDAAATAFVKGLFRARGGTVPPHDVLDQAGHRVDPPPLPPAVAEWQASEAVMRHELGSAAVRA